MRLKYAPKKNFQESKKKTLKQFLENGGQNIHQHVPPTENCPDRMVPDGPMTSPVGSHNHDKGPEPHLGKAGAVQVVPATDLERLVFYKDCFPKLLSLSRKLLRRSCPLLSLCLWRHPVAASVAAANGSGWSNSCKQ